MADLPEVDEFTASITQIEITEAVIGGPDGVSNRALKQLANRTRFLKGRQDALVSAGAIQSSPSLEGDIPADVIIDVRTRNVELVGEGEEQEEIITFPQAHVSVGSLSRHIKAPIVWNVAEDGIQQPYTLSAPVLTSPFPLVGSWTDSTLSLSLNETPQYGAAYLATLAAESRIWLLWKANAPVGSISASSATAISIGNPLSPAPESIAIGIASGVLVNMITSAPIDLGTTYGDWVLLEVDTREESPGVSIHTQNGSYPIHSEQTAGLAIHIGIFQASVTSGVGEASCVISVSQDDLGSLAPTVGFSPLAETIGVMPDTAVLGDVLLPNGIGRIGSQAFTEHDAFLVLATEPPKLLRLTPEPVSANSLIVSVPGDFDTVPHAVDALRKGLRKLDQMAEVVILSGHTLTSDDILEFGDIDLSWLTLRTSDWATPVNVDLSGAASSSVTLFQFVGTKLAALSGKFTLTSAIDQHRPLHIQSAAIGKIGAYEQALTFIGWNRGAILEPDVAPTFCFFEEVIDSVVGDAFTNTVFGNLQGFFASLHTNSKEITCRGVNLYININGDYGHSIKIHGGSASQIALSEGFIHGINFGQNDLSFSGQRHAWLRIRPGGDALKVVLDAQGLNHPIRCSDPLFRAALVFTSVEFNEDSASVDLAEVYGELSVNGTISLAAGMGGSLRSVVSCHPGSIIRWLANDIAGITGDFARNPITDTGRPLNVPDADGTLVIVPEVPNAHPHSDLLARIEALEAV